MKTPPLNASKSFEAANSFEIDLEELENISKTLENDDLPLDECVKLYERGKVLVKKCKEHISSCKLLVENIDKKSLNQ